MGILSDIRGTGHGIKCPRHYVVKPGHNPYVMERSPLLKNFNETDAKRLCINLWRQKKDKWGKPIQDFNNCVQPVISAALAREKIFQAGNSICMNCRRCLTK